MLVRYLLIGAVAMSLTAPVAAAEPAKPVAAEASRPENRPADVVLASAQQVSGALPTVQDPSVAEQTPVAPPVKKRAARVTTCRCADQTTQR